MAQQIKAPGLKWIPRNRSVVPYWYPDKAALARGFPTKTVNLAAFADDPDALLARCRRLQVEANAWGSIADGPEVYDGTFRSLLRIYEDHAESPYLLVQPDTRRTYDGYIGRLTDSIGGRLVASVTGLDLQRWFKAWRSDPDHPDRDHLARARMALNVLKAALRFGGVCGHKDCRDLRAVIRDMKFETLKPRNSAPGADVANAFRAAAHAAGHHTMALATAIQFETSLRQTDVIGRWVALSDSRPSDVLAHGQKWLGLRWSDIGPDMVLKVKPSKTSRTTGAVVEIDLSLCPMVLEEIARVPEADRRGPMIVQEQCGRPYTINSFGNRWRAIAREAGIPEGVWNRDLRAGGITEARKGGASRDDLAKVAGHSSQRTTAIYDREHLEAARRTSAARVAWRTKKERA